MKRGAISFMVVALTVVIAFTFGAPSLVTGTIILDQSNVVDTSGSNWTSDQLMQMTQGTFNELAQTFTVGVAGMLTQVDVESYYGASAGTVQVALVGTAAGVPNPSAFALHIGSISNVNSSMTHGSFVSFNLGANAFVVNPGDVYAILFDISGLNQAGSGRYWVRGITDTYIGGTAYDRNVGVIPTNFASHNYDYGFRTYVDVPATSVPEPTTMLLLGLGLVGLTGVRRKIQQ